MLAKTTDANLVPLLRYRDQNSELTLVEGLDEYFHSMSNLLDLNQLQGSERDLFTNHDVAHVVFGCDISLRNEVMMDAWTVFGTDVGVIAYARYLSSPAAQNIFAQIGYLKGFWSAIKALPDVFRVIFRARRMKAKWPWSDHERYMQRSLGDIRRELGLRILP